MVRTDRRHRIWCLAIDTIKPDVEPRRWSQVVFSSIEQSPQRYARIGGVLYLAIIVLGIFGEVFVRGTLVVSGDATATANAIAASEPLWRAGIAGDLLMHVLDLPMILLLGNAAGLDVFSPAQLHALSCLAIKAHGYGFGVGLIFFGFACLCRGYLIFRSGHFPRILGALMALAGLSYLGNSLALLLAPALASALFPAVLVPAFVGELSFALWLTFKGVNVQQWAR
jgi:hypothetical protein